MVNGPCGQNIHSAVLHADLVRKRAREPALLQNHSLAVSRAKESLNSLSAVMQEWHVLLMVVGAHGINGHFVVSHVDMVREKDFANATAHSLVMEVKIVLEKHSK